MKKVLIKSGSVIAALLMFSPLFVIHYSNSIKTNDFVFLLVCSILYDIYMYSNLEKNNEMQNTKKHYYKIVKDADKKLNLNVTYKEKFNELQNYVEELLEKYFD